MKLICPKCNLRMRIADSKVPPAGAWAKCPKCQERFFVNPGALPLEQLRAASPAATPGPVSGPGPWRSQAGRKQPNK